MHIELVGIALVATVGCGESSAVVAFHDGATGKPLSLVQPESLLYFVSAFDESPQPETGSIAFHEIEIARRQRHAELGFSVHQQGIVAHSLRHRVVALDADALLHILRRPCVQLELFDSEWIYLRTRVSPSMGAAGSVLYAADVVNERADCEAFGSTVGEATMSVRNGFVTATMTTGRTSFVIEPWGNGAHVVLEAMPDDIALPAEEKCTWAATGGQSGETRSRRGAAAQISVADIVTFMSPGFVAVYGSEEAARNKVVEFINETNIAFFNTGLAIQLKSVEIAYHNTTNRNDVTARRNELGADIAALLVTKGERAGKAPGRSKDVVDCGNAERFDEHPKYYANIVATAACADNNYTFAHEIAHVYDGNHETNGAPTRAYYNKKLGFQTLLSKAMKRSSRVLHFSNPHVEYRGNPTGTSGHDNASRMAAVAPLVASIGSGRDGPVNLFAQQDFKGGVMAFGVGRYGARDLGIVGNDAASSIEVDPGYEVTVCAENGSGGACKEYSANVPNLATDGLNNKVSFLEVRAVPKAPRPGIPNTVPPNAPTPLPQSPSATVPTPTKPPSKSQSGTGMALSNNQAAVFRAQSSCTSVAPLPHELWALALFVATYLAGAARWRRKTSSKR